MKTNLFKRLTAGALALLMLGTALPSGSDFTGLFSGSDIVASAEAAEYTLVYNAGDGSGTMKSETYGDNDSYKFPICTFTAPEGKVFSYWEMSGADGIYYPGSEIKIASNCAMDGVITVTACWQDNQCGDNAYWDFDYVTGTLTISGTGAIDGYADSYDVPWYSIRDKIKKLVVKDGITYLGNEAFSDCKNLSEAEIPDSVINFGIDVFRASGLESIDLSNTELIGIAPYTFSDCNSLTSVKLPKALKTIFAGAFTDCENLVSVHLPEGLTEIQYYAFDSCSALNSINIPASVTKIGYNAFIDCKKLSDIYCYAKSTIDWDTDDTSNNFKPNKGTVCHVLKSELAGFEAKGLNLTFKGDLNCGDNAYWDFDEETGTLTINGTGAMYDYNFINARTGSDSPWNSFRHKIKKVVIKDGITHIGSYAFWDCGYLSETEIPDSVTSIGESCFPVTGIESIDLSNTKLTDIPKASFNTCRYLKSVKLPETLKTIGEDAFAYCYSLREVKLPDSLTAIGKYAFVGCNSLEYIYIPRNVTSIGNSAFYNCSSLRSVEVSEKVTSIGEDAFDHCTAVTDVYCYADPDKLTWIINIDNYNIDPTNRNFKEDGSTKCHVIKGTKGKFETKFPYANVEFVDDLEPRCGENANWSYDAETGTLTITGTGEMFDYVYNFYDNACDAPWFDFRKDIKHVVIPEGITHIGDNAFRGCENLTEINIPRTVESIGSAAFYECYEVASVTFAKGSKLKTLADYSLDTLFRVEELTLPEGLESIGSIALGNLRRVKKITIPSTVTNIHWRAFAGTSDEINELYISADPSKLDWVTDASCFKKDKATICHVPVKYIGGYMEKFGEQNLTFIADCKVKVKSATGGKVTASKSIANKDDEITLTVTPNKGYKLKSLTVTDSSGNPQTVTDNNFKMPESDVTVSAKFEPISYAIVYNLNGGTNPTDAPTSYTVESETITLPTPTKKGYSFGGWYTKSDFSGSQVKTIAKGSTGKKTFYAKWTINKYTITYNLNGGTNPTDAPTSYTVESETITLPTPTRKGYSFGGWFTKSDFSGSQVKTIAKGSTGKKTFYAKWTINTYAIAYNLNGGTNPTDAPTSYTVKSETITLPIPTKKGYSFGGWFTKSDFSGSQVKTIAKGSTGKKTFYAKWTINTYAIAYNLNGGTNPTDAPTSYTVKSETITLPTPTKKGYSFGGWFTKSDLSGSQVNTIAKGSTGKKTFYAKWNLNTYAIAYNLNGGTNPADAPTGFTVESAAIKLPTPERKGYTFDGWFKNSNFTGSKVTSIAKGSTGNKTFYAKWTINKYTITWKNGDTVIKTEQVEYGKTPSYTGEEPSKKADARYTYTFIGWSEEIVPATEDAIYTAAYRATTNTYIIRFVNDDGTELQSSKVLYGETPKYTGKTPTKPSTAQYGYTFKGWDNKITAVKGKATYKAVYESKRIGVAVNRLAGRNRFLTAVEISKASFETADTVVLAFGMNYADALAGVPLANKLNAPILLTYKDTLDSATLAELVRLKAKKVVILGGTGAINEKVEAELKQNGLETERVAGKSRFGTAAAVAEQLTETPEEIFFVYAFNFADALSASTVAAIKGAPIIYLRTNGDIDADTAAYLEKVKGKVKKAYVIGGDGVISDDMMNKAGDALGITPTRLAGKNRYETCVEVNKAFDDIFESDELCIATGKDFPDALAGGVFAARKKAPLLLAAGQISETQSALLKAKAPMTLDIFGGIGAVSDAVAEQISKACIS